MASLSRKLRKQLDMVAVSRANPKQAAAVYRQQAAHAEAYAKEARAKADRLDPPEAPEAG